MKKFVKLKYTTQNFPSHFHIRSTPDSLHRNVYLTFGPCRGQCAPTYNNNWGPFFSSSSTMIHAHSSFLLTSVFNFSEHLCVTSNTFYGLIYSLAHAQIYHVDRYMGNCEVSITVTPQASKQRNIWSYCCSFSP